MKQLLSIILSMLSQVGVRKITVQQWYICQRETMVHGCFGI